MKQVFYATAIALTCLTTPAQADPQADIDYIISQTVTRPLFEAALEAQRDLITGAIQNDLRVKGITLTDPDRFLDLLVGASIDEFTLEMQEQTKTTYRSTFSDKELMDIAAFYKTDSGQALINATPLLLSEGSRLGRIAGEKAGLNAGRRLGDRIENEGLIVTEDPGVLQQLLDYLK